MSWKAKMSRKAVAPKVDIVIINLYFLVFLIKIELRIAPTVPNSINPTAPKDICRSLYPYGFIKKLALDPNIKNVP